MSVATYFVGGIASYMCNPGYSLDGSPSRRCESNQRWSGTVPTCGGKSFLSVVYISRCDSFKLYNKLHAVCLEQIFC